MFTKKEVDAFMFDIELRDKFDIINATVEEVVEEIMRGNLYILPEV